MNLIYKFGVCIVQKVLSVFFIVLWKFLNSLKTHHYSTICMFVEQKVKEQ